MIPSKILVLALLVLAAVCGHKVQQLNPQKLEASLRDNQFTFVYFYSSTCGFCQQFTPKFEQLAKVYPEDNINFGKADAITYKELAEKYQVYSYPTLVLFWQGIDIPIHYRQEREIENLLTFLRASTTPLQTEINPKDLQKITKEQREAGILFFGNKDSWEIKVVTVLSLTENFRFFVRVEANVTQPYIEVKGQQLFNFDDPQAMRDKIANSFGRLFLIEEESWLRIHQRKEVGIVFIDTKNNEAVQKILEKLAAEMGHIVFMRVDPSQEEFKPALDSLGLENDQGIFGVDEQAQAKFEAKKPYTEESLREFIKGVEDLSLPVYLKTERSGHKQKLTRANYDEKINEPKDIVLFLYREDDRIQKKFLDLFRYLTEKLKHNPNISFLRCNISKNQLLDKLEFDVKTTPWIIFFRHRMKGHPIHFQYPVISSQNVLEFIMENTTFDWLEEEGEL